MKTLNPIGIMICAVVLAMSALLSGCRDDGRDPNTAFVKYEVQAEDCTVKYVDNPRGYNFFIAKCPGASTTITHQRASGKSTTTEVTVVTDEVESLKQKLKEAEARKAALSKLSEEDKKILGVK
jgi:hypothetical protein